MHKLINDVHCIEKVWPNGKHDTNKATNKFFI